MYPSLFSGVVCSPNYLTNLSFNPSTCLPVMSLSIRTTVPTLMTVRIPSSKTDQFCNGITIIVGKGNTALCPIAAMLQYLSRILQSKGPLFMCETGECEIGEYLTKHFFFFTRVWDALRCAGIDSMLYKGHSFRIRAATTAAACGIGESLIETSGRWSSTAY